MERRKEEGGEARQERYCPFESKHFSKTYEKMEEEGKKMGLDVMWDGRD